LLTTIQANIQDCFCGRACRARLYPFAFSITLLTTLLSPPAYAVDEGQETAVCTAAELTSGITYQRPKAFPPDEIDNTRISADYTRTDNAGTTTLSGNVIIEKHLLRLRADSASYNRDDELLTIEGDVHIDTESMSLNAGSGSIDISSTAAGKKQNATFNNIRFLIPESRMKGTARMIVSDRSAENHKTSTLTEAGVTSCDLMDPDWLLSSDEIQLDHDDEYGYAEDVVMRFKGVPFLYTPYMEFPTSNRRRTGILFPEFGTSSSRGVELGVPWYWNIAPDQDALLTPVFMEKRGFNLDGLYRYLTESSNGQLKGSYLPDDKINGEDRYQVRYQQHTDLSSNLLLDIDYQDISDGDYFNDFANSLGITSQTHLDSSAKLKYALSNWQFNALLQDIETIDETTPLSQRPYERLPQLTMSGSERIADTDLQFGFYSEFVDFTHESKTKLTGNRLTIRPELSLPLSGIAWFVRPAIRFSHTTYDVGFEEPITSIEKPKDISVPITSIDTGLFFERYLESGHKQTLEPRLYYLYTPFEDQSTDPVFDTRLPEFSVSQLFRYNRFTGGDRVGDANQITAALTSRIIDTDTGQELAKASIGQIFYFEDRKVTLTGFPETASQSDMIFELEAGAGRWLGDMDLQWDTSDHKLTKQNYFLHYKSDDRHLFNIGYRQRRDSNGIIIEQTDTSFVYAITPKYTSFVRWNYSLKDDKPLDTIAGLAYNSCCWSIQLLGQRRIQNNTQSDNAFDNSILIQFVLKGLGSLSGSKARNTLGDSIYGYKDTLQ